MKYLLVAYEPKEKEKVEHEKKIAKPQKKRDNKWCSLKRKICNSKKSNLLSNIQQFNGHKSSIQLSFSARNLNIYQDINFRKAQNTS